MIFYLCQVLVFLLTGLAYRKIYPNLSEAVFQNMRFLLMIGIVMITRLSFEMGVRQFVFMTVSLVICLAVPFVIERFRYLKSLGWLYGLAGLLMPDSQPSQAVQRCTSPIFQDIPHLWFPPLKQILYTVFSTEEAS